MAIRNPSPAKHAGFARAAFGPIPGKRAWFKAAASRQSFLQQLEAGVHARFMADPAAVRGFVGTAVIAKSQA